MSQVNTSRKRVLLCPLDWGLGHTTRCIPLISSLIRHGAEVVVACTKSSAAVLEQQFGEQITYEQLPGYGINYGSGNTALALLKQLPKISRAIRSEKKWLHDNAARINPDAIISDNRYGCFHPSVPSIIITHQLQLQVPGILKPGAAFANKQLRNLLNNFNGIWVPDIAYTEKSLSGRLGHPTALPKAPVDYIGHLSHLPDCANTELTYEVAVILSGPEPQRTMLEKKILEQAKWFGGKTALVRGLPDNNEKIEVPENVQCWSFASSALVAKLLACSNYVVCRSGYSSLMDYLPRDTKCLLVPTPGQTEQEYLAQRLEDLGFCLKYKQHNFDLTNAVRMARQFSFRQNNWPTPNVSMDSHIVKWLASFK